MTLGQPRSRAVMRAITTITIVAALAVAACRHVPGPQEVQDSRAHAFDQAMARATARFGGASFEVDQVVVDDGGGRFRAAPKDADDEAGAPRPRPTRLDQRVTGQGADDVLYRLPGGGLALASPTCLQGGSCGCSIAIDYRYLRRDDGHIAIVRLTPEVEVIEVKVASCGYGCGQPPEPQPLTAPGFEVTDPTQLEVIEERYHYVDVRQTCANPIPAP